MIDKKKIGKAAKKYAKEKEKICKKIAEKYKSATSIGNWVTVNPDAAFEDGIDWFLKNLWHDIFNERIPCGKMVIVEYTFEGGIYYRSLKIPDDIQWVRGFSNEKRLRRWLYVDDLLPKEEHEQY